MGGPGWGAGKGGRATTEVVVVINCKYLRQDYYLYLFPLDLKYKMAATAWMALCPPEIPSTAIMLGAIFCLATTAYSPLVCNTVRMEVYYAMISSGKFPFDVKAR